MEGEGADADHQALTAWLARRLGATELRLDGFFRPRGSGFSAETHIFTAHYQRDGDERSERFVVRRETSDPAVYPQQVAGLDTEIDIQYRTMHSLTAASSVPLAPLVGYEPDPWVLGAPFFVMTYVDGEVPIENPLYTRSGFFVEAAPEARRQMITDGLSVLARLHAVDWQSADLAWLVPPGERPGTARQLDLWERYAQAELGSRRHPLLERALEWLHANLPEDGPVGFCWGDSRPGNMIWRDYRCVCVTDFEASCIACPEHDLGWWLMFDRWVHETFGVDRLGGEPTRDEQRRLYEELSGRSVGDTAYHEVFAAARYAAIVVRVMNRSVARGELPADQTIWIDNPASTCLAQLLDEVS
jgi:aminoglycoside phosphotransferase (APT) family kinase protein